MTKPSGPYARLYLVLVDDPKFLPIYDNDHHFATWCRLLMIAEPAWPASAHLPASASRSSIRALVAAGLIDLQTGGRFRIHGLDAERGRRAERAQNASNARWNPYGNARGNAPGTADSNPTHTRASGAPARLGSVVSESDGDARDGLPGDDGRADLEAFCLVSYRAPTAKQRQVLDGVLERHDLSGAQWTADIILAHPDDPIGAVIAADKSWRAERIAEAQTAERKPPTPRRRAVGLTGVNAELAALLRAQEVGS